MSFKQSILDAIEDNKLEMVMPSREYFHGEINAWLYPSTKRYDRRL